MLHYEAHQLTSNATYMYQVTWLVPSAVTNSSFSRVSEFKTFRPTLCVIRAGTGLNHGANEQIPHVVDEVGGGTGAAVPFVGDAGEDSPCAATAAVASTPSIACRFVRINRQQVRSNSSLFWFYEREPSKFGKAEAQCPSCLFRVAVFRQLLGRLAALRACEWCGGLTNASLQLGSIYCSSRSQLSELLSRTTSKKDCDKERD
jgi:hypothetical protein